ncbi:hypothetical protein KFE25_014240 [Diacronema lutheri]|uniref:Uncharacterized protein n=1 Tax=Diacronema lutheri TaxID=2081491 RepID=A0A8J5XBA6_DIALT|nr:hypothetical protein KFE25_014240 [Diacronema lutheri]
MASVFEALAPVTEPPPLAVELPAAPAAAPRAPPSSPARSRASSGSPAHSPLPRAHAAGCAARPPSPPIAVPRSWLACAVATLALLVHWRGSAVLRYQLVALSARLRDLEAHVADACGDGALVSGGARGAHGVHGAGSERLLLAARAAAVVAYDGAHAGLATSLVTCGDLLVSAGADGAIVARPMPRASAAARASVSRWEAWGMRGARAHAQREPFEIARLGEAVLSLHATEDASGGCAVLTAGTALGSVRAWRLQPTTSAAPVARAARGAREGAPPAELEAVAVQSLHAHTGAVHAIAGEARRGSDGRQLLATAAADGSIALWERNAEHLTLRLQARVAAHRGGARALALAAGFLISAGADGKMALWAIPSLTPMRTVDAHRSAAAVALAVGAVGRSGGAERAGAGRGVALDGALTVFSAAADGELKRWKLHALDGGAVGGDKEGAHARGGATRRGGRGSDAGAAPPELREAAAAHLGARTGALAAHATRAECVLAALADGRVELVCAREAVGALQQLRTVYTYPGHARAWVGALAALGGARYASADDVGSIHVWQEEQEAEAEAGRRREGDTQRHAEGGQEDEDAHVLMEARAREKRGGAAGDAHGRERARARAGGPGKPPLWRQNRAMAAARAQSARDEAVREDARGATGGSGRAANAGRWAWLRWGGARRPAAAAASANRDAGGRDALS